VPDGDKGNSFAHVNPDSGADAFWRRDRQSQVRRPAIGRQTAGLPLLRLQPAGGRLHAGGRAGTGKTVPMRGLRLFCGGRLSMARHRGHRCGRIPAECAPRAFLAGHADARSLRRGRSGAAVFCRRRGGGRVRPAGRDRLLKVAGRHQLRHHRVDAGSARQMGGDPLPQQRRLCDPP